MSIQQTFDFLDTSSGASETRLPEEPNLPENPSLPECPRLPEDPISLEDPSLLEAGSNEREADRSQKADRRSVLEELRAKVGCVNTPSDDGVGETLSTGSKAIDRLLPRGGLRHDAITEWVAEADGCGAASLSMIPAATHLKSPRGSGPLVVVGGQDIFHPPAAVALGVPAGRIIWVRPTQRADLVWAIDQSLRCESVAAVWAFVGANLDDRDARRFQLASETGHTPGLFIRPAATRGRPSFADVRFHVDNPAKMPGLDSRFSGRVMKITLDRCRGGTIGHSVWVQIDDQARIHRVTPQQLGISRDETATVRLATELAHPKTPTRKADRRRA
jgi:hypothetical protein